VSEKLKTN